MAIVYNEKTKIFTISTQHTTYMCGVYAGRHLMHLYYGVHVEDTDCAYLFGRDEFTSHIATSMSIIA